MLDNYNLNRFVEAQKGDYKLAMFEISRGRKTGHWIWYIFPQLKGLGRSYNSNFYGIQNEEEAKLYLNHPILGKRIIELSEILLTLKDKSARDIFGGLDTMKLKSSMTLFSSVSEKGSVFDEVLDKYFEGKKSYRTLEMLKKN